MRILYLLVSFALLSIAGCSAGNVNNLAGRAYTGGDMYDPDGRNYHDIENSYEFSSFFNY